MLQKLLTNKISYVIYVLLLVSSGLIFYIWNTTNPATINPAGILAVFILLYFFWLSIFFIILHASFILLKKTNIIKLITTKRKTKLFKGRTAYYVASILAFIPVLLLAIQSVNQLTVRDILLVFLFVLLAVFYVVKRL